MSAIFGLALPGSGDGYVQLALTHQHLLSGGFHERAEFGRGDQSFRESEVFKLLEPGVCWSYLHENLYVARRDPSEGAGGQVRGTDQTPFVGPKVLRMKMRQQTQTGPRARGEHVKHAQIRHPCRNLTRLPARNAAHSHLVGHVLEKLVEDSCLHEGGDKYEISLGAID
ncbi:MAG: hypothetical protein F4110_01290 [Acidimicrobiaceae bacterium]|nr:hypothetical protein [Acidimicrobiaceae bacterium]MYE95850.1 hypothetical protein [Acidimicrobiaceae bacterium]MYI52621.1 hypothetical protein [Acidimicrobiaceae bacterium]